MGAKNHTVIEVIHSAGQWPEEGEWPDRCVDAAQRTLDVCEAKLPVGRPVEMAIVLSNDEALQALNLRYRGKDMPTNTLSFPTGEEMLPPLDKAALLLTPYTLGDIFLSWERVCSEAKEQNKALQDHVMHLVVHSTLHLLGWDHMAQDEAEKMEALEIDILADMGITNPYVIKLARA